MKIRHAIVYALILYAAAITGILIACLIYKLIPIQYGIGGLIITFGVIIIGGFIYLTKR